MINLPGGFFIDQKESDFLEKLITIPAESPPLNEQKDQPVSEKDR